MAIEISLSSVPSNQIKIHLNKNGRLHVSGQDYQVKLASGEQQLLSKTQRKNLKIFFADFFKEKTIDLTKGEFEKFSISINENEKFEINITQKDDITGDLEHLEFTTKHIALKSLFDQLETNSTSNTPQLELSHIKESSLLHNIGKIFTAFVNIIFGKSSPLNKEIVHEFREIVGNLPKYLQKGILRQLENASKYERNLFNFLRERIDMTGLDEKQLFFHILTGAYIIMDDGGETYEAWSKFETKRSRISSHVSDATQFAIEGVLARECLFSRKQLIDEEGVSRTVSWFQFERYPAKLGYYLPHLWTYILYKVSGKNQGPMGSSAYSENNNPLVLKLKPKSSPIPQLSPPL